MTIEDLITELEKYEQNLEVILVDDTGYILPDTLFISHIDGEEYLAIS